MPNCRRTQRECRGQSSRTAGLWASDISTVLPRFHQHLQTAIESRGRESQAVSGKKTQQVRTKASRHLHRDSCAVDPDSDPERDLATLFS